MASQVQVFTAEAIGTAVLVMGGVGTAVLATTDPLSVGTLGVSIAFGLSLLVMVYAIGNISGCHINPAVTLGLVALGKTKPKDIPLYWGAQLLGAAVGAVVIFAIASGLDSFDATNNFAQNGWGDFSPTFNLLENQPGYNLGATAVVEIVLTAVLVFVVASSSHGKFTPAASGLAIGLTLALIHLISIPVDNTSVNPARSFASALFAGADAWEQLWAFVVFPLIGGALGALAWGFINDDAPADEETG